eukprot:gb/GEZN01021321.1/.p2 GENE.gb/GEZN01021321.1/~~gb/GEZN01021321.1/.p2  ORF type:complete len:136 (+),score=29.63 gb/GEZN01021321.1/:61-468(+)
MTAIGGEEMEGEDLEAARGVNGEVGLGGGIAATIGVVAVVVVAVVTAVVTVLGGVGTELGVEFQGEAAEGTNARGTGLALLGGKPRAVEFLLDMDSAEESRVRAEKEGSELWGARHKLLCRMARHNDAKSVHAMS